MSKRPITVTLLFWGVIGLILLYLFLSCGLGAGWDEESHQAISDCRYEARMMMETLNFVSIAVYSIWAVWAIRSLKRLSGK